MRYTRSATASRSSCASSRLRRSRRTRNWSGSQLGDAFRERAAAVLAAVVRSGGTLYLHNGLRAMLRDAGFEPVDSYWSVPEMRYPTHYVPTDAA